MIAVPKPRATWEPRLSALGSGDVAPPPRWTQVVPGGGPLPIVEPVVVAARLVPGAAPARETITAEVTPDIAPPTVMAGPARAASGAPLRRLPLAAAAMASAPQFLELQRQFALTGRAVPVPEAAPAPQPAPAPPPPAPQEQAAIAPAAIVLLPSAPAPVSQFNLDAAPKTESPQGGLEPVVGFTTARAFAPVVFTDSEARPRSRKGRYALLSAAAAALAVVAVHQVAAGGAPSAPTSGVAAATAPAHQSTSQAATGAPSPSASPVGASPTAAPVTQAGTGTLPVTHPGQPTPAPPHQAPPPPVNTAAQYIAVVKRDEANVNAAISPQLYTVCYNGDLAGCNTQISGVLVQMRQFSSDLSAIKAPPTLATPDAQLRSNLTLTITTTVQLQTDLSNNNVLAAYTDFSNLTTPLANLQNSADIISQSGA